MSNKGNKRKSTYTTELQSPAEAIIPTLILAFFVIFIGIIIFRALGNSGATNDGLLDNIEEEIWKSEYLKVESMKVGVIFNPISTTNEEYIVLRDKCNQYIDKDNNKSADAHIKVDTVIDEKQYIDNNTNDSNYIAVDNGQLSETGPIYFQDMLMIRYMNTDGRLKVVTAIYNKDKSDMMIASQANLREIYGSLMGEAEVEGKQAKGKSEDAEGKENTDTLDILETPLPSSQRKDWKSEEEYLSGLEETIQTMLLANTAEELRTAESKAINYFTYEGKQSVFDNRKNIKLSANTSIKTEFIMAGKSYSSKTYKDRIYMQMKVNINNEELDLYMILKLNSNIRIFDIDIV